MGIVPISDRIAKGKGFSDMRDDVHITPVNDIREHITSPACRCKPSEDPMNERVFIHNAFDGREFYERTIDSEYVGISRPIPIIGGTHTEH